MRDPDEVAAHATANSRQPSSGAPSGLLWGLFALALVLRAAVAFGALGAMPMVSDAESYAEEARRLLRDFPGSKPFYWPPGNPVALWAFFRTFGDSDAIARLFAVLCGAAWVPLTAAIAGRVFARSGAARAATLATGVLAALYAPALFLAGLPYAQHLSALSLTLMAWLALPTLALEHDEAPRPLRLILLGLCLGAGCLVRPSMLSLVPVFGLWLLIRLYTLRDRPGRGSLFMGGVLLFVTAAAVIIPAQVHNHRLGAGMVISTNNERNFFLGNNPYTPDYKTSHLGQRTIDQLPPETAQYLQSFYRQPDARSAMTREALRFIRQNPLRTLVRTWNRGLSFWGFDYLGARLIQEHYRLGKLGLFGLLAVEAGSYLTVVTLALLSLFALRRRLAFAGAALLLSLTLGYQLPYLLAFSGGTYHYPVLPLLLPLAGGMAAALFDPTERAEALARLRQSWLVVTLVLAGFAILQAQYAYHALRLAA